jgi:molybdate transport system substrate-binding protein
MVWRWLALLLLALGSLAPAGAAGTRPNIAAASDLKFALDAIAARFEAETGQVVALSYGSSGNFYRQILQGAPFEMFLSADEAFVEGLVDAGWTRDAGVLYAIGRIVLFAPEGSRLNPARGLDGLAAALAEGRIDRFAIANPEHAPYGRAAMEALQHAGIWPAIQARLVLGENVSQAAQFALSGSTEGGLFAYSLALAPVIGNRGSYVLIPADFHAPLRQRMVLLRGAGATAAAFYDYVQQLPAREILARYGFTLTDEQSDQGAP